MARSNARLLRFAVFALVLIACGYVLTKGSTYPPPGGLLTNDTFQQNDPAGLSKDTKDPLKDALKDPLNDVANDAAKDPAKEVEKVVEMEAEKANTPSEKETQADKEKAEKEKKEKEEKEKKEKEEKEKKEKEEKEKKEKEEKEKKAKQANDKSNLRDPNEGLIRQPGDKVSAVFISLARNSDIGSMSNSIRQIESKFNKNYHYDWVFLNDEDFNQQFKDEISKLVSGTAHFGTIPKEHWSYPSWIDQEKAAYAREAMVQKKVIYGGSVSYRHMCRFESGFFFRHELLQNYEYYWRVEPDIKIYCDIDYDIFKFMKDNDKMYGFTISLPEYKETIPTLWDTTKEFMALNPQYVDEDNNMDWISNDGGKTYNGCHFWSNFEVGSFKLWRLEAYMKYFDYLDKKGGFFYERWGDAPVHSIAASLFIPRDKIHFFGDVGYFHVPFHNCPVDEETRVAKKCTCPAKDDFTWRGYSCTPRFFTQHGLKRPKGWENFTQ